MGSLLIYAVLLTQVSTGVITGRLLSADGTPLAGVRIAAADASDPDSILASLAQTDAAGRYRLENILPGRYYLRAGQLDGESYYPGVASLSKAEVIAVKAGASIDARDFKFIRSSGIMRVVRAPSEVSGRFTGIVHSMQSAPIQNLTVLLADPQRNLRFMTGTNAAGAFEFSDLPGGQFSMEILSPVQSGYRGGGYEELKTSLTLVARESLQQEIRLRLVLASGWQRQPDVYARPRQTAGRGAAGRLSRVGPLRVRDPQRDPLPYPQGTSDRTTKSVSLELAVAADGRVLSARAVSAVADSGLVRAAIEAASRWTFSPMIVGNQPGEQSGTIEVYFGATER
jgi:TonB family protein